MAKKKAHAKFEIETFPLVMLSKYERNPRYNEMAVDAVMKSIEKFGFNNPILVNKEMTILAGHTRYEACKRLGYTEVPCIVLDHLTPQEQKAFLIADNKTSELAGWNESMLSELFNELKLDDFDLEFTAFSKTEIDVLAGGFNYENIEPSDRKSKNKGTTATLKLTLPVERLPTFKASLENWLQENKHEYVAVSQ
jgi:ParB-like chromosome segregation protein Spo0J